MEFDIIAIVRYIGVISVKYNESYLLLFPLIFVAVYIYNAVMAAFMSPDSGNVSANSRLIYSSRMHAPLSTALSMIFFVRSYPLVCTLLVIGQAINFVFGIFYAFICLFAFSFAVNFSVILVSVHLVIILVIGIILSFEHLSILMKNGKL